MLLLNESGNDSHKLLVRSRMVTLFFGLITALTVFFWSRKIFGSSGGLISLAFLSSCPVIMTCCLIVGVSRMSLETCQVGNSIGNQRKISRAISRCPSRLQWLTHVSKSLICPSFLQYCWKTSKQSASPTPFIMESMEEGTWANIKKSKIFFWWGKYGFQGCIVFDSIWSAPLWFGRQICFDRKLFCSPHWV